MILPTRSRLIILAAFAAFDVCSVCDAEEAGVEFLDVERAGTAIVDEKVEPYFSLLKPLEMSVKTGRPITGETVEAQREEAKRRYRASVLEFTAEERELLRWYTDNLDPVLREHYPKFARVPWKFLKVDPTIEGGLAHTRGDAIVLSPPMIEVFRTLKDGLPRQVALAEGGGILIHEKMHVVQRLQPKLFEPLYTEVWGFEKREIQLPETLEQRVVVNPDGVDLNWVYPIREGEQTRFITPRIIFAEGVESPRMPRDFRMIAVELEPASEPGRFVAKLDDFGQAAHKPLQSEHGYLTPGLRVPSLYHPNEIAADVFAKIVARDHLMPRPATKKPEDDLAPTRAWFAEHLK